MTTSNQKTISANIAEMHGGKKYSKVKARHGKKTANRMAVAAALAKARKSGARGYGMMMG